MSINELTGLIQEALVTLLCYDNTPKGARFVRALVPAGQFGPFYKDIAAAACDYLDKYHEPPGDHTADIIETLASISPKKAPMYLKLFEGIKETKDRIHRDYVLDHALAFAEYQRMNVGVTEALEGLQKETKEGLDEARTALLKSMKDTANIFDPGTIFTDSKRALAFLDDEDEIWPTGIKELDNLGLGPGPGRLHLFLARPKKGKSWWLLNLAKRAVLSGRCVVYITLEMSEKLVTKRAFQSFFSLTKREVKEQLQRVRFKSDQYGRFVDFENVKISQRPSLDDPKIASKLREYQKVLRHRPRFVIKQFPTGELTLRELEGYLDGLEGHGIVPDLLVLDYADLMRLDHAHLRESTGELYKGLRGMAVRRKGMGVASASQMNRPQKGKDGIKDHEGDVDNVAEDWSKIFTADTVLIYNQTPTEKALGLARIKVGAGREEADGMMINIAQRYDIGAFCMDSTLMSFDYKKRVEEKEQP